jgi:hypothetical protein
VCPDCGGQMKIEENGEVRKCWHCDKKYRLVGTRFEVVEREREEEKRIRKEEENKRREEEERKRREEEERKRREEEERKRREEEERKRREEEERKRREEEKMQEEIRKKKEKGRDESEWVYKFQDKIFNDLCPHCNSSLKGKDKGEIRECLSCGKEYHLIGIQFVEIKKEDINFPSLNMSIEDHNEYDSLSLTFLQNEFRNLFEVDIRHCFHHYKNLLIPTYCFFINIDNNKDVKIGRLSQLRMEREFKYDEESNLYFKEDKRIIRRGGIIIEIYMKEYNKRVSGFPDSKKIEENLKKKKEKERKKKG